MLDSVAWVTAGNYVNAGLAILRGLLFARILGPPAYGVWGFLSTIQTLAMNADLGIGHVAARDIPGSLARGESREADAIAALTRLWTPAACGIVGVALSLMWPILRWPAAPGWGLLVPLLLFGMGSYYSGLTVERGFLAFRRMAALAALSGLAGLVSGVVASRAFGVTGLVVSQSLVYGVAGLLAIAMRRAPSTAALLRRAWARAVRQGWRLLVLSLALQAFVSVDMLVAAWGVSAKSVGLYSVALLGSTMVGGVIASGVGAVAGQHLLRETAMSETGLPRSAMVWGPAAALAVVLAPACGAAALLAPTVLRVVLPGYAAAGPAAAVLLAAAYYLNSQFGFSTTFIAVGRPLVTIPLYVVLIVVNVGVDVVLLRQGLGLLAIAAGSLFVNVCFVAAHEALVGTLVSGGRRQVAQALCTLAGGALPIAAALAVLGYPRIALAFVPVGLVGWAGLVLLTARWLGMRLAFPLSRMR